MFVCGKDDDGYFINLYEFVFTLGALEIFLSEKSEEPEETETAANVDIVTVNQRKCDQPSIVEKFPEIVDIVSDFVKQSGFSAHYRRRTEVGSTGVSIPEIRKHGLENVPGLKEHGISLSTVRRFFEPPNRSRNASKRYKSIVQAKTGVKSNTYREPHIDAHYLFARNKQRREFAELFKEDIDVLSIDDMAKVKVGAPAVSRYHQLRRIYAKENMPNLSDHDFPTPGYLINVSGYMLLESTRGPLETIPEEHEVIDESSFSETAHGISEQG